jgi:hypothetical protein
VASVTPPWGPGRKSLGDGYAAAAPQPIRCQMTYTGPPKAAFGTDFPHKSWFARSQ